MRRLLGFRAHLLFLAVWYPHFGFQFVWLLEILGFRSPWLAPSHLCRASQLLLWLQRLLLQPLPLLLLSSPWLLGSSCLLLPSELAFLVPLSRLTWLRPPFPVFLISL